MELGASWHSGTQRLETYDPKSRVSAPSTRITAIQGSCSRLLLLLISGHAILANIAKCHRYYSTAGILCFDVICVEL